MKIGILTQPLHNNYGGLLQNYALQEVLRRMGHTVVTLDVNYKKEIKSGESVVSQVEIIGNTTNHILKCQSNDEILCNILIEWE